MLWQQSFPPPAMELTGRQLVVIDEHHDVRAVMQSFASEAGIQAIPSQELGPDAADTVGAVDGSAVVFEELGVAVVSAEPDRFAFATATDVAAASVQVVEPERFVYALDTPPPAPVAHSVEYLSGYRDAVLHLTDGVGTAQPGFAAVPAAAAARAPIDESRLTWGLQVTGATASRFTGAGVRVAVLDTGVDERHPDLAGRIAETRSFIAGEPAQDVLGHGTHCIGTVAGPAAPAGAPRYGVAPGVELYAGKVLGGPRGRGTDTQILAGVSWAIRSGCRIVSMSLGSPTVAGQPYSRGFETAARRALDRNVLIIAAAGNDSERPGVIRPVSHPANCPSIVAVAALDSQLRVAEFSNRGFDPAGGQVDFAGPGVDVLSAWIGATRYRRIDGTSMATPHVAGIAALVAEANPAASASALAALVGRASRRLALPCVDVGVGLVQAP